MATHSGRVAVVLPPREGFATGAVGAIGLQVAALASPDDVIVGPPLAGPSLLPGHEYRPVRPGLWPPGGRGLRYAATVTRVVTDIAPAVVEVHNRPDIAHHVARGRPGQKMLLVLHNDPQGMRGADTPALRAALLSRMAVACVSGWVRQRFAEGLPADAAQWIGLSPNGMNTPAAVLPQSARGRVVLFAGRVVADKGADLFVDACERLGPAHPGWRFVMIGADRFRKDAPATPFLNALAPRARAAGVEMAGYRPHADVLDAMAQAAIVVVPSRWPEPFGLTALEAMAAGAALVAAPMGGLPEVVGDGGILCAPEPVAGLAQAIGTLMDDVAARAALGGRGRARAARFSVEHARACRAAQRLAALRGGGG
ncbi:glycosyltransferase [Komagataeibacter melaceti]|uniref:Glycosyltransferase n=1 Tax=Komagataeibacter melaceti TaxID=2766577 RepID=A0A371YZN1_9PROT|nr:glycosyltransferase family 4 protein [Komagataeibacter melaceti]RFD19695.1 glycosyltransferase [Komagataeibacter melaceti]